MLLHVEENLFVQGRANVPRGHLIWPKECPALWAKTLVQDQEYPGTCIVSDHGIERYNGPAFVKRRKKSGTLDMLVILLPDMDIGPLSPDAIIDMQVDASA